MSYRRLWKCAACRKKFSVLVGTVYERSQVPFSKWLFATYLIASSKNGVAANELRRTLGVTQSTAWFMLHRLREAMKTTDVGSMRGTIVADETWIGGSAKNRHAKDQAWINFASGRIDGYGEGDKTPVLALIDAETGEVRSQASPTWTAPHCARRSLSRST